MFPSKNSTASTDNNLEISRFYQEVGMLKGYKLSSKSSVKTGNISDKCPRDF